MTENQLEYVRKLITPTNMNSGIWPKHYTDEHERLNMTEIPMKLTKIFKYIKIIVEEWNWCSILVSHSFGLCWICNQVILVLGKIQRFGFNSDT